MGMRDVIKKIFKKGLISKEACKEEDFDLLPFILKKREIEQKRKIKESKDKKSEVDAFLEILNEEDDLFTPSELCFLYKEIIGMDEIAK
ncbi:hypothetical protein ACFSTE_04000 [Aquimarina hainanensis]|uniref:Uncharacterized protein n=1 Tax=Aquimarina hainanensis TaxID=1578017 RepID=A0ABW5N4H8_9FLAO